MITHLTFWEPMFENLLETLVQCYPELFETERNYEWKSYDIMISFSAGNLRNESKQSLFSRYVHIDCIEAAFRARGLLWKTR